MNTQLRVAWETLVPPRNSRDGPLPRLLVLLTVVTGLVDAFSYLELGRVFVANMTGNVVFLAFAAGGAPRFLWWASLLAIFTFMAGAFVGGRIAHSHHTHRGRHLLFAATIQGASPDRHRQHVRRRLDRCAVRGVRPWRVGAVGRKPAAGGCRCRCVSHPSCDRRVGNGPLRLPQGPNSRPVLVVGFPPRGVSSWPQISRLVPVQTATGSLAKNGALGNCIQVLAIGSQAAALPG